MQSRESSPQTTEGDQDRLEKAGGDDGRIIDKGDASRAMSRGGEDEMMPAPEGNGQPTTTKEAIEGAGINLDPPTVDIPSLANPPVGPSSAQSTALPVQVASISGPLEHLSLDDWKATPGFGRLRKKVEEFLNAENTPLEASLVGLLSAAIEASCKVLVQSPTYQIQYPEWTHGEDMEVLVGKGNLPSQSMCRIYEAQLKKEIRDMGKDAGLSEEEALASTILRRSSGPRIPDMICQAVLHEKKIWTHVQEHKVRKSR